METERAPPLGRAHRRRSIGVRLGDRYSIAYVPGCRCSRTASGRRCARRSRTRTSSRSLRSACWEQAAGGKMRAAKPRCGSERNVADGAVTWRTSWTCSCGRQWRHSGAAQSTQKWFLSFLRSPGCAAHASKNSSDSRPRSQCGAPRAATGCIAVCRPHARLGGSRGRSAQTTVAQP
jgi:hypothetical protein